MSPSLAASKPSSENSNRFADAPAMVAVRESLPWSLAGFAVGLLVLLAMRVPIGKAVLPGLGCASLVLAAVLSYRLAVRLKLFAALTVPATLAVFILALPRPYFAPDPVAYLQRLGGSGLFLAMIAALAVAAACWIARKSRAGALADAAGCALILVLAGAAYAMHVSLGDGIVAALHPLTRLGDTLAALLIITAVETLLWTFGIHGPATLAAVVTPLYLTLQTQNSDAFSNHQTLPHTVVVSTFLFVFPGGAGATLPVAAYFALSKVSKLRTVGRVAIVPALFNINEPLMFGAPLVANPYFAVPFTLVPLLLATVTWLAMTHGFVSRPAFYMPSSIPSFISTFSATLDWRAPVLMAINIAIAAVIYWPFFKAYERHMASTGSAVLRQAQHDT